MSTFRKLLVCWAVLAAVGCQDDLPIASQIVHLRVLGAATQVVGDETRTTPKPGERAKLTWSMVYPDPQTDDSDLSSIFIVCTAPEQFTGTPICQEFLDIAAGGSIANLVRLTMGNNRPDCEENPNRVYDAGPFRVVCVTGTPQVEVEIGADVKSRAKFVQGLICRNGVPELSVDDPTGSRCRRYEDVAESEVERIAVYGTVPIQYSDADANRNPSIDAATFGFHDPARPWNVTAPETAEILSDETCYDESRALRVTHTEGHKELITLEYDANARELVDGEPERLEFAGYSTFGELERRFTVFDSDEALPLKKDFTWEITQDQRKELDGASKRVRFFFTLMDGRGGFAITSRDVCINRQ